MEESQDDKVEWFDDLLTVESVSDAVARIDSFVRNNILWRDEYLEQTHCPPLDPGERIAYRTSWIQARADSQEAIINDYAESELEPAEDSLSSARNEAIRQTAADNVRRMRHSLNRESATAAAKACVPYFEYLISYGQTVDFYVSRQLLDMLRVTELHEPPRIPAGRKFHLLLFLSAVHPVGWPRIPAAAVRRSESHTLFKLLGIRYAIWVRTLMLVGLGKMQKVREAGDSIGRPDLGLEQAMGRLRAAYAVLDEQRQTLLEIATSLWQNPELALSDAPLVPHELLNKMGAVFRRLCPVNPQAVRFQPLRLDDVWDHDEEFRAIRNQYLGLESGNTSEQMGEEWETGGSTRDT